MDEEKIRRNGWRKKEDGFYVVEVIIFSAVGNCARIENESNGTNHGNVEEKKKDYMKEREVERK